MTPRPIGTVTFVFTDVEGSTKAWESSPDKTRAAFQLHDEIATRIIEHHHGAIILERGEGDSIFAVFARASDAAFFSHQISAARPP